MNIKTVELHQDRPQILNISKSHETFLTVYIGVSIFIITIILFWGMLRD